MKQEETTISFQPTYHLILCLMFTIQCLLCPIYRKVKLWINTDHHQADEQHQQKRNNNPLRARHTDRKHEYMGLTLVKHLEAVKAWQKSSVAAGSSCRFVSGYTTVIHVLHDAQSPYQCVGPGDGKNLTDGLPSPLGLRNLRPQKFTQVEWLWCCYGGAKQKCGLYDTPTSSPEGMHSMKQSIGKTALLHLKVVEEFGAPRASFCTWSICEHAQAPTSFSNKNSQSTKQTQKTQSFHHKLSLKFATDMLHHILCINQNASNWQPLHGLSHSEIQQQLYNLTWHQLSRIIENLFRHRCIMIQQVQNAEMKEERVQTKQYSWTHYNEVSQEWPQNISALRREHTTDIPFHLTRP